MSKKIGNTRSVLFLKALIVSLLLAKIVEMTVNAMLPGVDVVLREVFPLIMASIFYMPFLVFFDRRHSRTQPAKPGALASFHMFF